jgi:hypothetical protein
MSGDAVSKTQRPPGAPAARTTARLAAGMVCGAAAGFGMASLARALGATKHSLTWSDDAGLLLATTFMAGGAYVAVLASDRRRLARAMECEADVPASNEEVTLFRLQALGLFLAGVLVATPVLLAAPLRVHPEVGAPLLAGFLALLALQSWLNWRTVKMADEFVTRVFSRAAVFAFVVGQAGLLAWAAAERFVAAPPLRSFDVFVILTALYVAGSAYATLPSARRA